MCFGSIKRICHWGPLTAIGIIKLISYMMICCSNMLLPMSQTLLGFLNMTIFVSFSSLTIYNFLSAILEGPGYLPYKWVPENITDEINLQKCSICKGFKAPRSHHCKKCDRCILKMDHHCPWINNCVGHVNHAHFTYFLLFSVCGYYYYQDDSIKFTLSSLIACVFSLGLSIGVSLAVGALLFIQIRGIVRNRTGIEDWIYEKAILRRTESDEPFIFPYNLGWKNNLKQILTLTCTPSGNGLTWPIIDGCTQYTLTIEQKEQKLEKRERTRPYRIIKNYSGRFCPVGHGWRVCTHPPCTDEARIKIFFGDTVLVTRWREYWLFGEKLTESNVKRIRGWFPRCCATEIISDESYINADFQLYESKKDQ